ncbi:MAG: hypothetical protein IKN49_04080 [Elusimicrobiaceae bacterium]|nr:hypothetical protein [Elusimicrobiaceae bacterium]
MKKFLFLAILFLSGCYAPLNNSGVSTNKSWLEIPAKKTNFEGKQYDSCYQFKVHFVPAEAEAALDGQKACIHSCCWRSDQSEIVWDFNKDFEKNLRFYGRAERYTPEKITLQITHSNLLNTTAVHVSPRGAISANGTVKLKHKTVENPARLAQIESQARQLQARRNAWLSDQQIEEDTTAEFPSEAALQRAKNLVQRAQETKIDRYFYQVNQEYRKKGYIFLVSQRIYQAAPLADGTYRVACYAKVQSGASADQLENRTLSCGVWRADTTQETVSPLDARARQIKVLQ